MDRSDWLLLLVAARADHAIDPVRVQKGLFLLTMDGVVPLGERYVFVPYSYGPMAHAIYQDTAGLERAGLLASESVPGHAWRTLRVTAAGLVRARETDAGDAARSAARSVRHQVDSRSFAELLEHVYARHPEFATRSVFRRRRR